MARPPPMIVARGARRQVGEVVAAVAGAPTSAWARPVDCTSRRPKCGFRGELVVRIKARTDSRHALISPRGASLLYFPGAGLRKQTFFEWSIFTFLECSFFSARCGSSSSSHERSSRMSGLYCSPTRRRPMHYCVCDVQEDARPGLLRPPLSRRPSWTEFPVSLLPALLDGCVGPKRLHFALCLEELHFTTNRFQGIYVGVGALWASPPNP